MKSEEGDAMKLVTAVVKLEKLDQVVHAVAGAGGRGLTATEAIAKAVSSGTIGDGKIWISPVESALRVRTGERDLAAV
jgi:nitrogen regulatory protein PII